MEEPEQQNAFVCAVCASVCTRSPTLYQVYSLLPGGLDELVGRRRPPRHLSEWDLPLVMSQMACKSAKTPGGKTEAL